MSGFTGSTSGKGIIGILKGSTSGISISCPPSPSSSFSSSGFSMNISSKI